MINTEDLALNYITNQSGEKTAVILPIEQFEELLEDIEDLAIVAERRDEPTTSHIDLIAELKQDDLLLFERKYTCNDFLGFLERSRLSSIKNIKD